MSSRVSVHFRTFIAVVATTAFLVAPTGAGAATIVNGDFETGNLTGWTQANNPLGNGEWRVYSAASTAEIPVPPPPAGLYAAVTIQEFIGTRILYQDVTLEPFYSHRLSLIAYYRTDASLVTPIPNTLASGNAEGGPPENEQYRIDVIRPTAPIDSVNPADILATLFATKTGDPKELAPTTFATDLTPFAGQTVRLRLAEVDNIGPLQAGVDSVSIQSALPSNAIALGKPVLNKKKGTANLPVTIPGAGTLKIADARVKGKKRVKAKTVQATAAGTLKLPVKPTKYGRKALVEKGKLKLKVAVTFTPIGGIAATQTRKLVLKLTLPK